MAAKSAAPRRRVRARREIVRFFCIAFTSDKLYAPAPADMPGQKKSAPSAWEGAPGARHTKTACTRIMYSTVPPTMDSMLLCRQAWMAATAAQAIKAGAQPAGEVKVTSFRQ